LGGTLSLHTNSLDEAYALPSEHAATVALRTQQVIAYESGVTNEVDPLGGSYFVERLTLDMEKGARDYIRQIDDMGGMIAAIEKGFPQSEIADASYRYQREVETGEKTIVGVNRFTMDKEDQPIDILKIPQSARDSQAAKLKALRNDRNHANVSRSLTELKRVAEGTQNTMPQILEAVRAYATLGEICDAFRDVFGTHDEQSIL
jgi:methylmalonyl-CoA mutase N-terminal domain/subunit